MSDDKTEEASPRRLEQARERGEVWKSKELAGAASLLAAAAGLGAAGPGIVEGLASNVRGVLDAIGLGRDLPPTRVLEGAMGEGLVAIAPVLAGAMLAGALVTYLQVGSLLSFEAVAPKLERLDVIGATLNLFSTKRLVEFGKSVLILGIVAAVAYDALESNLRGVLGLSGRGAAATLASAGDMLLTLLLRVGGALVAIGALDALYQRWRYHEDQKMTKEEVKREHKDSEGDPHAKHQRTEMHREIIEHGVLEQVRRADVLVVNPTHYAVALRYDEEAGDDAPEVLAKGLDGLAQRMIAAAREAGVPVMRDVPLAHALYELEVGDAIPESLYEAVAIVLRAAWDERGADADAEAGASP